MMNALYAITSICMIDQIKTLKKYRKRNYIPKQPLVFQQQQINGGFAR